MKTKNVPFSKVGVVLVFTSTLLACQSTGTSVRTVTVTPMCTILCTAASTTVIGLTGQNGRVFLSERVDPNVDHGFAPFRPMSNPRGNPALIPNSATGMPDTYGISEAWLRWPGAPEVHRAQATPAARIVPRDLLPTSSAWNIRAQDASGTWSGVFGAGSATRSKETGDDVDTAEAGAATVPRLMPVGLANPQMFACAGARTADNAERTTWLIESTAPSTARGTSGGVMFIQDLLNGDDRFVPNAPGPLIGPATAPTPTVSGPGNPIRTGSVQCGMTQLDDDLTTRELHMIAIDNGILYHSMANNFGPVTREGGSTFSRFRTVSAWGDVGQALGGGFGPIISAAIVAHPTAISVFFVAESGGRYRLWHAVRFSSGAGSWRPVKDVLALSGDAANGTVYPLQVAAGTCPAFGAAVWDAATTETLIALWGGPDPLQVLVIRVVSTPRQWRAGVNGIYSPWRSIPGGAFSEDFILRNVVVTGRPFRDDALPPP